MRGIEGELSRMRRIAAADLTLQSLTVPRSRCSVSKNVDRLHNFQFKVLFQVHFLFVVYFCEIDAEPGSSTCVALLFTARRGKLCTRTHEEKEARQIRE